jgi:hypothetical protein
MGFMDSVQNAGLRARLNGEILLIDRDLVARKKLFGVEIYDAIDVIEKKNKTAILSTPNLFKGIEAQIKEPLELCRNEIRLMEGDKASKESEQTHLEVKRERDTKSNIGTWVSRSSADAKLTVEIALLERQIKIRKEKFGLDIWDIVAHPTSLVENITTETKKEAGLGKVTGAMGGLAKGVTSKIAVGLGKLSSDERTIQDIVEKAKEDVIFLERSKSRKHDIIGNLASK